MSNNGELFRLSAFSDDPAGGNPAGVWVGDALPSVDDMQRIAASVGYSETAFIAPRNGTKRTVRYYSPLAEVPFCGHATIATGVTLGRLAGPDQYTLASIVGDIALRVQDLDGRIEATLTSVDTKQKLASDTLVENALQLLDWRASELDSSLPPMIAYAGAWHLVLAVSTQDRLNQLSYDFDALKTLMLSHELTTLQLVWRESDSVFHSRNPFPVGGVVEDAATGAAAAAFAGYLRDQKLIKAPFSFDIRQGEAMGRPSLLKVGVPATGGIDVSGTAAVIDI